MVRKPESKIQDKLIPFLEHRNWLVEQTQGNIAQKGFPDLFCHHVRWQSRWIDVKVLGRYEFTNAQIEKWPKWSSHGVGIWILTAATEEEYDKLFQPPNWRDYWKPKYGRLKQPIEVMREINAAIAEAKQMGVPPDGGAHGDGGEP